MLLDPSYPSTPGQTKDLEAAARTLGVQLHVLSASSEQDFDNVFATVVQLAPGALVIGNDPFFISRSAQLAALPRAAACRRIYQTREFAAAGGLMSYGPNLAELYRMAGTYTGRILKGEKPADLPVQQSTKFELVINLKTAKALGLTVPPTLLGTRRRGDRMRRREFITLLGGAARRVAARGARAAARADAADRCAHEPCRGRSRRPGRRRGVPASACSNWAGATAAMCGSTTRWAANDADRDRKYAAELVALAPDVILASGTLSVAALQHVTRTLPIVFVQRHRSGRRRLRR